MSAERESLIRALFDEYIERYAGRDPRLVEHFSENFSGYAGASDVLVHNRDEWIRITQRDFAQVPGRLGIEMLDIALQDLCPDLVAVTAFFHIHLPQPDPIFSRETARLVLVFRCENGDWKICHSGISIPYHQARDDEIYPMADLHARNRALEALVEERTEALRHANARLESLSNTDALTGIANRRCFDRMLQLEWKRGQRRERPLAAVMIDVDFFKHFNDWYGHPRGDECLRALAGALTRAGQRAGENVARYGGEEFVLLLAEAGVNEAFEVARRIQREVRALALAHAATEAGFVTVSIGVASQVPAEGSSPQELIRQADAALYRAKQGGRNRVCSPTACATDACTACLGIGPLDADAAG
ncbi:diguanylate cyclase [Rhodocyclus tenuis]|uniref:diguanylate cyclase n=1 Tax=Rhodocyclus gracilis TaxID=2929842 RepID=A0ABX0WL45_9RHOO|nr:diguanylate cyclase [Rhodocyclus gracilis]